MQPSIYVSTKQLILATFLDHDKELNVDYV
jgi:hypothetical protein